MSARQLYSRDGTQRGDEVAGEMRAYYEANKPLRWWQRRKPAPETCIADDLMLELRNIVLRAELNYRAQVRERSASNAA